MNCLVRRLAPLALLGPLALGGCAPAPSTTAAPAEGKSGSPRTAQARGESTPGKRVTPVPDIDPRKQVDVVREEIGGGEAAGGPTPFDYLWQPQKETPEPAQPMAVDVPLGLEPLAAYVPPSDPMTRAKWELGRQLYFEPRISLDGTVSCATCHDPAKGWTDRLTTAIGIDGQVGARNAPTVLNTVYGKSMFWDGRAPSLEGQAQGPIQNPIEMGKQSFKEIIRRLREIPGYQEQFRKVFGTDATLDGLAKAIATFERTALSGNSRYDRYQNGDPGALSESEKRGMVLFGLRPHPDDEYEPDVTLQKAKCTLCHVGFNFTDEKFHNLGVGYDPKTKQLADLGRWAVTPIGSKDDQDWGAFKTPMLRDLVHTAPYMHDGSEKTLEDVIEFYDRGGDPNPALDPDIQPLKLTGQEQADLVAFLKALTGEPRPVELPKLPPGPDGKAPDPAGALTPPGPKTAATELHGLFVR